jgi:hypothetical protein
MLACLEPDPQPPKVKRGAARVEIGLDFRRPRLTFGPLGSTTFMDWKAFIAQILTAIAWPVTVIFIIWSFKDSIASLIPMRLSLS